MKKLLLIIAIAMIASCKKETTQPVNNSPVLIQVDLVTDDGQTISSDIISIK